jgi:hexosaminidase
MTAASDAWRATAAEPSDLPLVPWPPQLQSTGEFVPLTPDSRIVFHDDAIAPLAAVLAGELKLLTGLDFESVKHSAAPGDIEFVLEKTDRDRHTIAARDGRVVVSGTDYSDVAAGTATVLQLLRQVGDGWQFPAISIVDGPALPYCGTMLDVARKPYSIDVLKQCVEVCRFYKIRYLHLHLTDENAWVFPSQAFPRLGSQNFAWAGGEPPRAYPREELRALVAYADARGVTLVPEIELPGHSGQLRGTLPEIFGCRGADGQLLPLGVINMASDEAYAALDTLLGEAADIFRSSPYLHVGGDESSLGGLEQAPEVQDFMARHKLTSIDQVFNHFVNRLHQIITRHGKQMIVWEGAPLDPVRPPRDLIVMPWVGGSSYASDMVQQGYSVINAPWGTPEAYFDPYLVNGARLAPGEPLLHGATSLLWERPETSALPFLRGMAALRNEPAWNPAARRGHADFLHRHRRTEAHLDRLLYGVSVRSDSLLLPQVFMQPDAMFTDSTQLTLETSLPRDGLRYTLDGSEPVPDSPAASAPINLHRTTTLKARWFDSSGGAPFSTFERTYHRVRSLLHAAVGADVVIAPAQTGYPGPGPRGLTDGFLSTGDQAGSPGWIGWERGVGPIRVDIDLQRPTAITSVAAHCLRAAGGIMLPAQISISLSMDGADYQPASTVTDSLANVPRSWFTTRFPAMNARYVRLDITPAGDWTFLDEIAVNADPPPPTESHAARGKPVTFASPPSEAYALPGIGGLTDGYVAISPDFTNPVWLGIEGRNFDATIDLEAEVDVREVRARFLQYAQAGIWVPPQLDVLISTDGREFRTAATVRRPQDSGSAYLHTLTAEFPPTKARYVRVVALTNGQWLFADEVEVNPIAPVSE